MNSCEKVTRTQQRIFSWSRGIFHRGALPTTPIHTNKRDSSLGHLTVNEDVGKLYMFSWRQQVAWESDTFMKQRSDAGMRKEREDLPFVAPASGW
jgi:hypothetical protein